MNKSRKAAPMPEEPADPVFLQLLQLRVLVESIKAAIGVPDSAPLKPLRRVVRAKIAAGMIGDSNSQFWARQNPSCAAWDISFPRSFKLGNSPLAPSVWYADELESWLAERALLSRKRGTACRAGKDKGVEP